MAPLADLVHPGWLPALEPHEAVLTDLGNFLRGEVAAGRGYLPVGDAVLRAFRTDPQQVRVLLLGQDPYPTPGHAVGLSFSVAPDVRPLPRSLQNIFREYHSDLGLPSPRTGDLSDWADAGVWLLNRVLTVQARNPGSHRGKGWEQITEAAVRFLAGRGQPLVAILWGRDAQTALPFLGGVPTLTAPHPSPLSADRGFFGSRPFTRANALLAESGGSPIDWRLPS